MNSIVTPLSEAATMAQPTEIDALPPIEDTEIIWPDDIPDAPEFQDEDEPRTPMNLETEPDTRDCQFGRCYDYLASTYDLIRDRNFS